MTEERARRESLAMREHLRRMTEDSGAAGVVALSVLPESETDAGPVRITHAKVMVGAYLPQSVGPREIVNLLRSAADQIEADTAVKVADDREGGMSH